MDRNVDFSRPVKTIISQIKEKYEKKWIKYQKYKMSYDKCLLERAKKLEN